MPRTIIGDVVKSWPTERRYVLVEDRYSGQQEFLEYAAYMGVGSPEFVAQMGMKLSFREAKVIFPSIEEKYYRS